jgi:hypothetical protein
MNLNILFTKLLLSSPCITPPYAQDGSWCGYSGPGQLSNSTQPINQMFSVGTVGQAIFPILTGALYLILMVYFKDAPAKLKMTSIAALVFVISIFAFAAGWTLSSFLNFVAFFIAWILSYLYNW